VTRQSNGPYVRAVDSILVGVPCDEEMKGTTAWGRVGLGVAAMWGAGIVLSRLRSGKSELSADLDREGRMRRGRPERQRFPLYTVLRKVDGSTAGPPVPGGGGVVTAHRKTPGAMQTGPGGSPKQLVGDPPEAPPAAAPPQRASSAQPTSAAVTFPQIARLELDDLLEQLVDRAQDVLNTQGRLRGLLAATRSIAADLSLPVLLRRIAEASCQLVGARYGALGVVGSDNQLTAFITVGVDEQTTDRIGHLPRGKGILGRLISDPRPLRLEELGSHPDSVGFPAGHPPMGSFLGVPIRVRDQVFGNLYLTEKTPDGTFTAEDEELLGALAAAAGVAIDNARLYEAAQRRQLWLTVSAEIVGELLAEGSDPLPLIAARARQVAEADLATILVPLAGEPDSLLVAAADGMGAGDLRGRLVPRDRSLPGRALTEDRDLVIDDALVADLAYRSDTVPHGPVVVVVRVRGAGGGLPGILSLSRKSGARRFDPDERELVATFAGHAGLALELAHAQKARRQLLLVEDRDRIARDLHDVVIQRLFATGLGMNSLSGSTHEPATRQRLDEFTDELDGTIRAIRQTIFHLQHALAVATHDWCRLGGAGAHTRLDRHLEMVDRALIDGAPPSHPCCRPERWRPRSAASSGMDAAGRADLRAASRKKVALQVNPMQSRRLADTRRQADNVSPPCRDTRDHQFGDQVGSHRP
jgi:GAF domain-containing protein